jgi:hypothetical protein
MKMGTNLIPPALLALAFLAAPETGESRVTMTGMIQMNGFSFNILETATFTVDDWLSNPNLWWLTIDNPMTAPSDTAAVVEATINVKIFSSQYNIIDGYMDLINVKGGNAYRTTPLTVRDKLIVNNTIISSGSDFVHGNWSTKFKDEVLRIGSLPEGSYTLSFALRGKYSDGRTFNERDVNPIAETIDIKNPLPPELVTPDNGADNVVTVPRFAWQAPSVTNLGKLGKIRVTYTITLWKMFTEIGATLTREEAIRRVPNWQLKGQTQPSVAFDPGTAREELIPGRKYCWQVQAFDGVGRYISALNEGKSDIWEFTVKFTPAVINEPILFFPLRFTWTGAQAGGAVVRYDVAIADNQDFSRAYESKGQILTSFTYPSDAPMLRPGRLYYIRIRATDDKSIPIGSPTIGSFTIPTAEVSLIAPDDNATAATLTPIFRWQGTARSYVVTVFQEGSRWSVSSGKVDGTSWTYDGEELKRGTTYSWRVAPSDERGEPAGPPSPARRFIVPEETQITLSSPVNLVIDTVFPTFTWNGLPRSDSEVSYVIEITTEAGAAVHSANVTATSYQYPQNAPALSYGTKYLWSVKAQRGGSDIGQRSSQAWFVTPFAATSAAGGEPTFDEVGSAIKQVLADYPQFSPFKDMNVIRISDQSGPISPAQFLGLIDKYRIKSVTAK